LRYYLISVAIHGLALGAVFSASYLGGFAPPRFSIAQGDGAVGGGDVPEIEGEFVPPSHAVQVRLCPVAPAKERELRQSKVLEAERRFAPQVDARHVAHELAAAEIDPPPAPPPPVKPARDVVAATADIPKPLEAQHAAGDVDVGELMETSTGPEMSGSSASNLPPGGGGHGGESGGQPTPFPANISPPYPPEALARGVEGKVTLRVLVGEDGNVRSARVEFSSGDVALDQSALTTVRDQWHFEPARRAGMAVEMEVRVPINFHLRR
jgi:TonB family protein